MKSLNTLILKIVLLINLLAGTAAFGQKLPSVQKEPMQAPAVVKIDGIASEWDDAFKANNNATDFKYLMANDKDNLYIVLQSDYPAAIQKILTGGITFSFTGVSNKAQAALTYPVVPRESFMGSTTSTLRNTETTAKEIEDLDARANHVKEIPVSGMEGITDATISPYNELGIKAAQRIGVNRLYTLSFAFRLSI